jgi:hypothetical protein
MQTAQALRAPMRDNLREKLKARAARVTQMIARTLRHAGISAKARVQVSPSGGGRVVVYVQRWGAIEASLLLPGRFDGFDIKVV